MNLQETDQVLMVIARHQQWFTVDEMTSLSWHESLDPSIDRGWAVSFVTKHFSKHDTNLTASALNRGWRDHLAYKSAAAIDHQADDAKCPFVDCRCSHDGGCYKGWIDNYENNSTAPCPRCRPSLYKTLHEVNPLGKRTEVDNSIIRNRFKAASSDF